MAKYCYNCGNQLGREKYCRQCGTDTSPERDVFFTQESCGDCDADIPRWANFCLNCGRKFGFIEPIDPQKIAVRNKGLVIGAIFFTFAAVVLAFILTFAEDTIPLQYALIGSAVFIIFIWIITAIRWERGKYKDGTVINHRTEKRIRSERDINNTTITGKPSRIDIPYTLYITEVKFDDGTLDTFNLECAANHIQLNPGTRVRYYLSTRTYRKL